MLEWLRWYDSRTTAQERKLLVKIDWYILSFFCLSFFVNYLDRVNYVNAYVSGMGKALKFHGHQFNNVSIYFTSGFAFGQIPQNLLLLVVPGRILFPLNCLVWGGLTMASAGATKVEHLYVIKFFQGIAESSTFIGVAYIMGSWYKTDELGKRLAIFACSAQIAAVFSGPLQARIYTNLNGSAGLAGWQWLYLICGIITVPIALYGFFFFPGTPGTMRTRYFSDDERQLALERLPPKHKTNFSVRSVLRIFSSWEVYLMTLIWIFGGSAESIWTNALMSLWLKSEAVDKRTYTIQQINNYPSGGPAVAVVALLLTAFWGDHTKKRYVINFATSVFSSVAAGLLFNYDYISTEVKFFAFYLGAFSYAGQAANFAWASELAGDDDVKRAVIIAVMNTFTYVCNSAWSIKFFPANAAPKWRRGMIVILVTCPLLALLSVIARRLQIRELRFVPKDQEVETPPWTDSGSGQEDKDGEGKEEGGAAP